MQRTCNYANFSTKSKKISALSAPSDFDGSMMDPDGAIKKSERFTATVEGSGPLFKKKNILLFVLEKAAAHVEKQGILLFAFRKSSNHCTICFRKAEIVVKEDVPCRATSAI